MGGVAVWPVGFAGGSAVVLLSAPLRHPLVKKIAAAKSVQQAQA
jgi:hypothetical protein